MRNLFLSFVGALVGHILLFLSPLVGLFQPVDLEQPRQGGGIIIHLGHEVLAPHDEKTMPSLAVVEEVKGAPADSSPQERIKGAKGLSAQEKRNESPVLQVERPGPEKQNEHSVFDEVEEVAHFESSALANVGGDELEVQDKGGGVSALSRAEAVPMWDQNVKPLYPPLARRRGWQGKVLLEVMVDKDGTVGFLEIHTGSGHRLLDKTAVDAVRKWHFMVAQKDGLAVPSRVLVPIHFSLLN